METANLPSFLKFRNAKNQIFVLGLYLQKKLSVAMKVGLEQNWGKGLCPSWARPKTAIVDVFFI